MARRGASAPLFPLMAPITVSTILDIVSDECHINDQQGFRRALVRSLQYLRAKKFDCSERTTTFPLQLDVDTYGIDDGVPGDLLSVNGVPVVVRTGGKYYPMDKEVSIQEMRAYQSHVNIKGYPRKWCWFSRELIFHPVPSFAYNIQLDYWSDCTRDQKTGVEITDITSAEDFTNPLLSEHTELVVARTAYAYFLGKGSGAKEAGQWKILYNEALSAAMGVRDARKLSGAQIAWNL